MKKLKKILIINGPNLNLLGSRESGIYGSQTLKEINSLIKKSFYKKAHFKFIQTNYEGKIIDLIQNSYLKYDAVVINAGGYSHYSVAISDAIRSVKTVVVSVHLTDISRREDFRQRDIVGEASQKVYIGKGINSYLEAINYLLNLA